jgi:type III restriction enzyme
MVKPSNMRATYVRQAGGAHRGAGVSERARKPIMQKFITGSDSDGLPALPLVLGMSATLQRFTEPLGNSSQSIKRHRCATRTVFLVEHSYG